MDKHYKVPVFLPNSEVVVGEADVNWAADGNDVTIKMKLTPSFDGERMAGLLMVQETALAFIEFRKGVLDR